MVDYLFQIDKSLLYFINVTLSNPVFDLLMPFITNVKNWLPVYLLAAILILYYDKKRGVKILIGCLILIIISDQFSSSFLKNIFYRPRPMNDLYNNPFVNVLIGGTSTSSFPSSHSVNNLAIAVYLSYYYEKLKKIFYITAITIGISRVYVGAHYLSDVLAGALIGLFIGYLFVIYYNKLIEKYFA